MTDRTKFEQMLEHLINEETDKAKELFHQLVVEKSREIYENILEDDFSEAKEEEDEEMDEAREEEDEEEMDESKEEDEEEMDESKEEDEDEMDESFGFAEADDEGEEGDIGGDAGDDFIDDVEASDDEEMGDEGDLEDRVVDLEDALEDLKAEFEQLMAGEEGEGHGDDMDMDMDMGGDKELEDGVDAFMREYVEKVGSPKHGDNGANAKSVVAGKNDMGGTTANIVKGGESTTGGTKGGLLNPSTKEDNAGNVNVPGGKAGVKHLKKVSAPKGGAADADKSAGSPLNGAPGRAK